MTQLSYRNSSTDFLSNLSGDDLLQWAQCRLRIHFPSQRSLLSIEEEWRPVRLPLALGFYGVDIY